MAVQPTTVQTGLPKNHWDEMTASTVDSPICGSQATCPRCATVASPKGTASGAMDATASSQDVRVPDMRESRRRRIARVIRWPATTRAR